MSLPFKSAEFDPYSGPLSFTSKHSHHHPHSKRGGPASMRSRSWTQKWKLLILVPLAAFCVLIFGGSAVSSIFSGPDMYNDPSLKGSVVHYDLQQVQASGKGWQRDERVLFLVPLRDAASHLDMFFGHMQNLTYPHRLIDLAFLVSDTTDNTLAKLHEHLGILQTHPDPSMHFGEIEIFERDFGQAIGQGFSDRHGFEAQGPRRKLMARARNWLLFSALKPTHSWVYWRDADVQVVPPTILEDLMSHDKDVIVPNVWRPLPDWLGYEQPYDLNSWSESETGLQLAEQLDEDAVIVEGYPEYATWRPHLAYLRDPYGDKHAEMELDGIGGVSILAKARVFRSGAQFPAFSFMRHAETEGFGKMCRRMGFSVVGLPHYVIWHIYEPSSDDLKHMEWMAQEELKREAELKLKESREKIWKMAFDDVSREWAIEKNNILKNTELEETPSQPNGAPDPAPEGPAANIESVKPVEPKVASPPKPQDSQDESKKS